MHLTGLTTSDSLFLLGVVQIALYFLQRSKIRKFHGENMAAIDDLNASLDAIGTEIDKIATEQQTLIDELKAANEGSDVDLTGAIAKATAIQAKLQAIDDLQPDAPVTAAEPTV